MIFNKNAFFYIGIIFLMESVHSQILLSNDSQAVVDSTCSEGTTCESCIVLHPQCHWCISEKYEDVKYGRKHRCASKSTLILRGCPVSEIDTALNEISEPKNSIQSTSQPQLQPSSQEIKLRPHQTVSLNFSYHQQSYHPVDLYYLTDISFSMKEDLTTVSRLALDIANEMRKMTKVFRMGFGSFVDKPLFPFVAEDMVRNPCQSMGDDGNEVCEPPYVYQHFLSLTSNIEIFQRVTNQAISKTSGNIDAPEAGLDALMQVALCDEIVGWNKAARKIVLFATDGSFHVAGDGRLAGLVRPPPQKCMVRMAEDRFRPDLKYLGYHDSIYYDYPSVGELARVLESSDISVIFAVIGNYTQLYSRLAEMLPVAKVGQVRDASSNIVELIRENYKSIVTTVELSYSNPSPDVQVEIETKCFNEKEFSLKSKCENHPLGESIDYRVKIKPLTCLSSPQKILFNIKGVDEKSQIMLSTACDCPLCKDDRYGTLSPKCSDQQGVFVCGICKCDPKRTGEFCECSTDSFSGDENQKNKCRLNKNDPICSGHGICKCGVCKCENPDRFSGKFCECDRDACPRSADDNSVCGGPTRGICECDGKCSCKRDYTGASCDCMLDNSGCFDSQNRSCSDNGDCDCGMCMCHSGFTGLKCNENIDTSEGLCNDFNLRDCVRCIQENVDTIDKNGGDFLSKCFESCSTNVTVLIRNAQLVNDEPQGNINQVTCVNLDDNSCRLTYFYRYTTVVLKERKIDLWIKRVKDCPVSLSILVIILAVVFGVVLIGILAILIWKLVVTIDDRREYAQFIKENSNAKWVMEENPIFTEPVTMVKNPMFAGDK